MSFCCVVLSYWLVYAKPEVYLLLIKRENGAPVVLYGELGPLDSRINFILCLNMNNIVTKK